jgi:poly-gamma-glutamate synthesis protein (capsule biosynthesis protein)
MLGRGVDQILPHPCPANIYERAIVSAEDYVTLAERVNGPIPRPSDYAYPWGDGLAELERVAPDVRIVNLETAITRSEDYVPKGINYRMSPENAACLAAAGIDCCVLANNHVLDWGERGLRETLATLDGAGIRHCGAGLDEEEAAAPATLQLAGGGRVLVFAFGSPESGVDWDWAASQAHAGINFLGSLSRESVRRIAHQVNRLKVQGDLAVVSVHWGSNWGYQVPREQIEFARLLIDEAGVDVVHGHSSHHARGIEVYRGRLILYGCGDLLNDYEGIEGHDAYRAQLVLMYCLTMDRGTGQIEALQMAPFQLRKFQLRTVSRTDAAWLADVMNRECSRFGAGVDLREDNRLTLRW